MMTNGAIYIITQNERYFDLLQTSAASLKQAMPNLPITVFSQFPVKSKYFDDVVLVEPTQDGFYDKTVLMRRSPYERTLFIDADIYVIEPFPELFVLLDQFDCAATHEEYLSTDWFDTYPRPDIPSSFPEFNTGIFLFKRSDKMDRLLLEWARLYKKHLDEKPQDKQNDQPFFRAAAYFSDVRMATLTREYNCKFRGQGYLNGSVKIIHGHVNFQLIPSHVSQAIAALNASKRPRVYVAGEVYEQKLFGRLVGRRKANKVGSFPELPGSVISMGAKRLRQIIKERGFKNVLAKVWGSK